MQFTVTLELNDQELKALSKGNFEEIRKDFFQNADFCNFVINTYGINNEFLDLALAQHKISTFSFGKIFEKFNLLDYPLKLSESEFKQCLLHWSLHDEYQTIAKKYWQDYFETILHFLGTSKAIFTAKNSNISGDCFKNYEVTEPNIFYFLANFKRLVYKNDIVALQEFMYSSNLKDYWNDDGFIISVCKLLEPISNEITILPISAEHVSALLEYAKKDDSNFIWALSLYKTITVNNKCFIPDNILEVVAYHPINLDECTSAYKSGCYHIGEMLDLYDITSWNTFEKALLDKHPDTFSELQNRVLHDVHENPEDWFFTQFFFRGSIHDKVSKFLEQKRGVF